MSYRDNAEKAIQLALSYYNIVGATGVTATQIIETATTFELYLSGQQPYVLKLEDVADAAVPIVQEIEALTSDKLTQEQIDLRDKVREVIQK